MSYVRAAEEQKLGRVSVVTPPSGTVISTADLKTHLRVDNDDEDAEILAAMAAAIGEIEAPRGWLGRSLLEQTLRLTFDCAPPTCIQLPGPPIQSISSVKYRDTDNTFVTLDSAEYLTDLADCGEPGKLWPVNYYWPATKGGPDQFRVEYVAGYSDASEIPSLVKQWLKLRVGDWYRDRETVVLGISPSELPHAIHMLTNLRVRV